MAKSRRMKSVPHNFLEVFCSRYSDIDGYWMLGLLVSDLESRGVNSLTVDLLSDCVSLESSLIMAVCRRAVAAFQDQVCKAGFSPYEIRSATFNLSWSGNGVFGHVNLHHCIGRSVVHRVCIVTMQGRMYEFTKVIFVAPHNPLYEHRSTRGPC